MGCKMKRPFATGGKRPFIRRRISAYRQILHMMYLVLP